MADPRPGDAFESERPRLLRLAYQMLGSPDEAHDVVQDAWLRWNRSDTAAIDNPAAWLTTVTARIAIDRLTSAQHRRETYVGPWIPEPLTVESHPGTRAGTHRPIDDPADSLVDRESLELGLLRVLETLNPMERAVFLLHDVLGYPYQQISTIVDKRVPATRQIAHRARARVRSGRPRLGGEPADLDAWSTAFFGAVVDGEVGRLVSLLSDDVVHLSDGGAARRAARRPVVGPDRVARLLINLSARDLRATDDLHWVRVNGQTALYVVRGSQPFLLTVFGWRDDRVCEVLAVLNPTKLERVHSSWRGSASQRSDE